MQARFIVKYGPGSRLLITAGAGRGEGALVPDNRAHTLTHPELHNQPASGGELNFI